MAEYNRPRLANLRGMEAGLHMHRRAEAVRTAVRGSTGSAVARADLARQEGRQKSKRESDYEPYRESAVAAWWHNVVRPRLRWPAAKRSAGGVLGLGRNRWIRGIGIGIGAIAMLFLVVAGALWWRLASGPISFDFATPWLTAAIADNFGDQFKVEIGGTVLERDEHGRAAMRIRGIMVRDRDGTVIASAPKAEVGFSSSSLLGGRPRAERLNLVGAELAVRVEPDGRLTISTGVDKRPLATTPALASIGPSSAPSFSPDRGVEQKRSMQENVAAFLSWVDSLGALGLDGGDLTEVGLKSGNLVVDDRRNGHQSRFENIHLSVTRPHAGVLEFQLGSEDAARPWLLVASLKPGAHGTRTVDLDARQISIRDILLALRMDGGDIDVDAAISATLRGEIEQDGTPQVVHGRVMMGPGAITDLKDPLARIPIERADVTVDWDAAQHVLTAPFQIASGGARITLAARAEAPREASGPWGLSLTGGSVVLPPQSPGDEPLQLNRVVVRGRFDPVTHKLNILDAEASGKGVGVAMSGSVDFTGSDPKLNIGLAARNMSLAAFKQLWPTVFNPEVRNWVMERANGGTVEQGEIATNAPLSTLRAGGPPVPDDGLHIQITTTGTTVRPFDGLPEIRDADLVTRVRGRNATVSLGRAAVEMPSGRRLTLANGTFEVPDTQVKNPPSKVRIRMDGPVAAAAELLSLDRIRDAANVPLDPAATRGNVVATINLAMPLNEDVKASTLNYTIAADIVNFAADQFLMSQKVEAQTLRATANNQGYQIKGEMRIGGAAASVDLRHTNGEADSELRLAGTLDDAARSRLGLDPGGGVSGAIPIKVGGRVAFGSDQDNRLLVEADFTPAKVDNLFPGWTKNPNRPARASFIFVGKGKAMRFDDVAFDGGGASIRGNVEFDQNGDFATASFPIFGLSDGDRANLRLEHTPDNLYKVTVRGEAFDARTFVKSAMAGANESRPKRPAFDFDLDAKLASVTGFKGEGLRNVDLHLLRRGGVIRNLALNAKFAGDGALLGELRGKPGERQIVYLESTDAGALFRFTDTYSHMIGGQSWIAMDPPTPEGARQEGLMEVREFAVRGEQALDSVVAGAPNGAGNGVQFSHMRVSFTRAPGKMSIHEGIVTGPMVGATIDGVMDYAGNDVHMRGTFVPLYGLNTAFGQVPIVGFLLGGKEGLIGSMTYEVVGTPGAPVLRVNPISMVAPGFVRKFLEFPSGLPGDRFQDPWRQ